MSEADNPSKNSVALDASSVTDYDIPSVSSFSSGATPPTSNRPDPPQKSAGDILLNTSSKPTQNPKSIHRVKSAGELLMDFQPKIQKSDQFVFTRKGASDAVKYYFPEEINLNETKKTIGHQVDANPGKGDGMPPGLVGESGTTTSQAQDNSIRREMRENPYRYQMDHPERGYFVIFNQENFDVYNKGKDKTMQLSKRLRSSEDVVNLEKMAQHLGFEHVQIAKDYTAKEILDLLQTLSKLNHSQYDCFACAILTHGRDQNTLYARDKMMKLSDFTRPFGPDFCLTLAEKPKLFFIQACSEKVRPTSSQSHKVDGPGKMDTVDENKKILTIPVEADYMIAHSTIPEKSNGSIFIQSVCTIFNNSAYSLELMLLMTQVNRMVAYKLPETKQIPSIATRLTAELYFTRKRIYQESSEIEDQKKMVVDPDIREEINVTETMKPNDDQIDANPNAGSGESSESIDQLRITTLSAQDNSARRECRKNTFRYKMDHPKRGCFVIFNQEDFSDYNEGKFKEELLSYRMGSSKDAANLEKMAGQLGFEYIRIFNNCTKKEILDWIFKLSGSNHSSYDCFACAILTHGGDGDILYASDKMMKLSDFTRPFGAAVCSSLAEKPKLFFIQACRGKNTDPGANLGPVSLQSDQVNLQNTAGETDTEDESKKITIPAEADYMIANSTVPEYYSFRDESNGSIFIQDVCAIFNSFGDSLELMQLMTRVNRMMAYEFLSQCEEKDFHEKKQIPSIATRLTAELYFTREESCQESSAIEEQDEMIVGSGTSTSTEPTVVSSESEGQQSSPMMVDPPATQMSSEQGGP